MKYQGSKNRTASEIIPLMTGNLNKGDYFVDLFCGGSITGGGFTPGEPTQSDDCYVTKGDPNHGGEDNL